MIHSELLADQAVLVLTPAGPLTAADFTRIAAMVDPYIEQHGKLKGLLIHASSFPGSSAICVSCAITTEKSSASL